MECGLVGLPSSGKTTLFRALTGMQVDGFSEKPHLGQARIPDPRLDVIAGYIPPQKVINATIQLVDIPGVPPGGDARKLSSFLVHVRQVDAVCQVVRAADYGGLGAPDPARDIGVLETELVLADLVVAESAAEKAARPARTGDAEAKKRLAVVERCRETLEAGQPVRAIDDWSEPDALLLKSFGLITAKPMFYVANVGEDDPTGGSEAAAVVKRYAESVDSAAVAVCAGLEAELAELEPDDRGEMLESLGLAEPAIGPLARAVNSLLGQTCFYTAGPKEVRAWIIPLGATAPEAAGTIHTDIERGFIRAECFHVDDLVQFKSEKAIKEAGKLRSEGKGYAIRDGDVVHFLFNV